jgi:hypothetical protein
MTGRAWPQNGQGGTLTIDGEEPGMYYTLAASGKPQVGADGFSGDITYRAVAYGVRSIQRALNRLLPHVEPIRATGVFDEETSNRVKRFQYRKGLVADGAVGPRTSRALFAPIVARLATAQVPACLLLGQIQNESAFDPGAVGYVDDRDLGLMQINGRWHPEFSEDERFSPVIAISYAIDLYEANLRALDGVLRDAVAAYNLGAGGARTWIEHGRPDVIEYLTDTGPIYVRAYIDRILAECPRVGVA